MRGTLIKHGRKLHRQLVMWTMGIEVIKFLEVPLCYFPSCPWKEIKNIEIHGFGDAS